MGKDVVWIEFNENLYLSVRYDDLIREYFYVIKSKNSEYERKFSSKNEPIKLTENDSIYGMVRSFINNLEIPKTITEVFEELQKAWDNPECSINPIFDSKSKPTETYDNILPDDNETENTTSPNDNETETDNNPNSDYIPSLLEKYDNDILKMLDDNLPEYVGDKTNLAMLILSVVAVKCGLKSFIININGDSLSGKSTLIKTLFELIPDDMVKNHNNSTISGMIRDAVYVGGKKSYDKKLIDLGFLSDERKKQMPKIEEFLYTSYKMQNYTSTMGSKSSTDKTMQVYLKTDTFMTLTQSITPYKSSRIEINDITSYLTVKPIPKNNLKKQKHKHQKNNEEFLEKHRTYIDNLSPMDIEEEFFNNQELLEHIIEETIDLNYEELHRYQMLYLSCCIYLKISPSIESFDRFQSMTPKDTTLTDEEEALIKFLKKHHTIKESTLERQNTKKYKYFSIDKLKKYHSNIKVIKEADDLDRTINNLVSKGALNKNTDNLFYLND